jgi:hypothetical protein
MRTKKSWKHAGLAAALALTLHGPARAQGQDEFLKSRSGVSFMEASGSGQASDQDPVDASGTLPGKAKLVLSSPQPRARASADVPAPSCGPASETKTGSTCKEKLLKNTIAGAVLGGVFGTSMMPFIGTITFGTLGAAGGLAVGAVRCAISPNTTEEQPSRP